MDAFPVSVFVCHMSSSYLWRPEEATDPLELELEIVVGHHVGARN